METREETATLSPANGLEWLDPRRLRVLGLAVERDRTIGGPELPRFSFWAECECPGDCNRDHENE
jgi:hypothetical protein